MSRERERTPGGEGDVEEDVKGNSYSSSNL